MAAGNVRRFDYSPFGDLAGGVAGSDFNGDGAVDEADFAHLDQCSANGPDKTSPAVDSAGRPCLDADLRTTGEQPGTFAYF